MCKLSCGLYCTVSNVTRPIGGWKEVELRPGAEGRNGGWWEIAQVGMDNFISENWLRMNRK